MCFSKNKKKNKKTITYHRIYGDNIIECIRIIEYIKNNTITVLNQKFNYINQLSSEIVLFNKNNEFHFELIPGFEKSAKKRWKQNILDEYKIMGSLLDETADAIITTINGEDEKILVMIEFCSALQAGNQAWQRSGRAYSCASTKIPYFYIIDLPKYELDPKTRDRLALRFPNAVVPYSYITYSELNNTPAYQIIIKSPEYNKDDDEFKNYDMDTIFDNGDFSNYLLSLIIDNENKKILKIIKQKNKKFVDFLSSDSDISLSSKEIRKLDPNKLADSIFKLNKKFNFGKKVAKKSLTGNISKIIDSIKEKSTGVFSNDLPFGLIEKKNIPVFIKDIENYYTISNDIKTKISNESYIIIAIMKGFKPGGEDNRPDRGILPLIRMLFGDNPTVLTIIYGPLIEASYNLLSSDLQKLSNNNGLWQTIINLSDYLLYDCPIKGKNNNTSGFIKLKHNNKQISNSKHDFKKLDLTPQSFREDDVDTLFYLLFKFHSNAFYSICNPPGGDWSGVSLLFNNTEYRWFSLPRVSEYKRPDHVIQLNNMLLIMESKEKGSDLEKNIGPRLSGYIEWLLNSNPNVERKDTDWNRSNAKISFSNYTVITSGSFISPSHTSYIDILKKSSCDIIFSCVPVDKKWEIDIFYKNKKSVSSFINETRNIFSTNSLISKVNYTQD